MNRKTFIACFFTFFWYLIGSELSFAQKILWARQLGSKGASAEFITSTILGEGLQMQIHADQNLYSGTMEFRRKQGTESVFLKIKPTGEMVSQGSDSILSAAPDSSAHIRQSRSRNGNSYLAYGRSSALQLPQNPEWNLAFLDGNQKRLWDIALDSGVKVNSVLLLANGNCLIGGGRKQQNDNLDLWLAVLDAKGKKIWEKQMGGRRMDEVLTLAEDAGGWIFAGGYCAPDSGFLGNTEDLSGRDPDGFIAAFDAVGNEKFFYRQRGKGLARVESLHVREDGNLFFVSSLIGSDWKLPPFGFPRTGKKDLIIGLIDTRTRMEKESSIRIFPNPAREIVYFSLIKSGWKGKAKASLQLKDGSVLQEMEIRPESGLSYRFNVSNTAPGPYFLSVKSGNKEFRERLLVE